MRIVDLVHRVSDRPGRVVDATAGHTNIARYLPDLLVELVTDIGSLRPDDVVLMELDSGGAPLLEQPAATWGGALLLGPPPHDVSALRLGDEAAARLLVVHEIVGLNYELFRSAAVVRRAPDGVVGVRGVARLSAERAVLEWVARSSELGSQEGRQRKDVESAMLRWNRDVASRNGSLATQVRQLEVALDQHRTVQATAERRARQLRNRSAQLQKDLDVSRAETTRLRSSRRWRAAGAVALAARHPVREGLRLPARLNAARKQEDLAPSSAPARATQPSSQRAEPEPPAEPVQADMPFLDFEMARLPAELRGGRSGFPVWMTVVDDMAARRLLPEVNLVLPAPHHLPAARPDEVSLVLLQWSVLTAPTGIWSGLSHPGRARHQMALLESIERAHSAGTPVVLWRDTQDRDAVLDDLLRDVDLVVGLGSGVGPWSLGVQLGCREHQPARSLVPGWITVPGGEGAAVDVSIHAADVFVEGGVVGASHLGWVLRGHRLHGVNAGRILELPLGFGHLSYGAFTEWVADTPGPASDIERLAAASEVRLRWGTRARLRDLQSFLGEDLGLDGLRLGVDAVVVDEHQVLSLVDDLVAQVEPPACVRVEDPDRASSLSAALVGTGVGVENGPRHRCGVTHVATWRARDRWRPQRLQHLLTAWEWARPSAVVRRIECFGHSSEDSDDILMRGVHAPATVVSGDRVFSVGQAW